MPIRQKIWNISTTPKQLKATVLASEQSLEDIIFAAPQMLSEDWMLIGRQVPAGPAGRLDILAIDPVQNLIIIELKKDQTPRDVVAQCLDYGSVVGEWGADEVLSVYEKFNPKGNLKEDFETFFRRPFEEGAFEGKHQLVVAASTLDKGSERIVKYLSDKGIPINVVYFSVWDNHEEILLSRAWLIDPADTQLKASIERKDGLGVWNGEYYVSFGHGEHRSWDEAVRYGFVSGGGKPFHSRTLDLLSPGDRIWVNVPRTGYVGVGIVTASSQPIADVRVFTEVGEQKLIDLVVSSSLHKSRADDEEKSEYVVMIKWLQTTTLDKSFRQMGLFGNQNTVCKPVAEKWERTVRFLKQNFPEHHD